MCNPTEQCEIIQENMTYPKYDYQNLYTALPHITWGHNIVNYPPFTLKKWNNTAYTSERNMY